jgi:dihydrofolate reductase
VSGAGARPEKADTGFSSGRATERIVPSIDIVLVVAVAENGVIGRNNALPWRIKSDLQYFRSVTIGRPVVMGRKTFQSIGRPLPRRTNIVVSRDAAYAAPGILAAADLARALEAARGDALRRNADSIAVIGGTEIFRQTLPFANRLVVTEVHAKPEGDTYLPEIDPKLWREIERRPQPRGPDDDYGFSFVTYERSGAA